MMPTEQSLQQHQFRQPQQGHILRKNKNGQYQWVRVVTAGSGLIVPGARPIRLTSVPGYPTMAMGASRRAVSQIIFQEQSVPQTAPVAAFIPTARNGVHFGQSQTFMPTNVPIQRHAAVAIGSTCDAPPDHIGAHNNMPETLNAVPMVTLAPTHQNGSCTIQQTVQTQTTISNQIIRPDSNRDKCRDFLAGLVDLSNQDSPAAAKTITDLIQKLIDASVTPEYFINRLAHLMSDTPQPCLVVFFEKYLPSLRQSLVTKEVVINGINPPPVQVAFNNSSALTSVPAKECTSGIQTQNPLQLTSPQQKPGGSVVILSDIPVRIIPRTRSNKIRTGSSALKSRLRVIGTTLSTVLTRRKAVG